MSEVPPNLPLPAPAPGLTAEHLQQLAAARELGAKIHRAVILARINGWTTAVFSGLTVLGSLLSPGGLLLGLGMGVISWVEFRGAAGLRRLDRTTPGKLALNQGVFALMLFLYGAINLILIWNNPNPLAGEAGADRQLAEMLAPYEGMAKSVYLAVYGGIILAALTGPALIAVYYWSRRKYIEAYLQQTPAWIQQLQKAGMNF